MKPFTIIAAILLTICTSRATIDGFARQIFSGGTYTVPSGKVLILQQLQFPSGTTSANCYIPLTTPALSTLFFPSATNGVYTLPKALYLPAGTILGQGAGGYTAMGLLVDTSDMPLFVGGSSSFGPVVLAGNTMTGELKLASTASSKVLIQSSTDLVNWSYDTTVTVQPGSDKGKVRFTIPIAQGGHYYRALVRRTNV